MKKVGFNWKSWTRQAKHVLHGLYRKMMEMGIDMDKSNRTFRMRITATIVAVILTFINLFCLFMRPGQLYFRL